MSLDWNNGPQLGESHPTAERWVSSCIISGRLSSCHRLCPLLWVSARAAAGTRPVGSLGSGSGWRILPRCEWARKTCSSRTQRSAGWLMLCWAPTSWRPEQAIPKLRAQRLASLSSPRVLRFPLHPHTWSALSRGECFSDGGGFPRITELLYNSERELGTLLCPYTSVKTFPTGSCLRNCAHCLWLN